MSNQKITIAGTVLIIGFLLLMQSCTKQKLPSIAALQQDALTQVQFAWNPQIKTPSFIRGRIPVSVLGFTPTDDPTEVAFALAERYADFLRMVDPRSVLEPVRAYLDKLQMKHVTFTQRFRGIEVFGGVLKVHLSADGRFVVAITNGFLPGVMAATEPGISVEEALNAARQHLPNGQTTVDPELMIYAGMTPSFLGAGARLAWMVELIDNTLPARKLYAVDALKGTVIDSLDRLYITRDRKTYTANNGTTLPGTLVRDETAPLSGDVDVDRAHLYAAEFYDYFNIYHDGRDSYDDGGATLSSTAHYRQNYSNAFWNGSQTVYGDGFVVLDVVAHEWTHALTENTAAGGLVYRWQSGALNESFSDIFGACVDSSDWLMGEDLPTGPIRDLSDPPTYNQPGHTSNWLATCSDNEGVHTNSGITNKAFYHIATAIGRKKAASVFYRTLTEYLGPNATLEDARQQAIQSASDLYGTSSPEYQAVIDGFTAVGLDGSWNPPENDCPICPFSLAFLNRETYGDEAAARNDQATFYRVRDELMAQSTSGQHYRQLYRRHRGRISQLLMQHPNLLVGTAQILKTLSPRLVRAMDHRDEGPVLTESLVWDIEMLLAQLADADQADGGSELNHWLDGDLARIEWEHLHEMSLNELMAYLDHLTADNAATLVQLER